MVNIPKHIFEQTVKGNDIVNVVGQYVHLEKKGRNYFGLCPFHHENTPSFSVSPEKQIFHCFSCGEGGDVIQFISKIEGLSHFDSVMKLAKQINLNIDEILDDNNNGELLRTYEMNRFVSEYYQFALQKTSEGTKAIEYLKNRNITEDIIKRFNIGLAPDSVNSLYMALKANQFSELMMIELGHVIKSNDKFYDKFKNRIMFPITDEFGNILGFSGRVYLEKNKGEPKYINTQETSVFKKGQILYNLDHAKKMMRQNNRAFLFEGFMDVIAASKSGLEESVATMGTALTDEHVYRLKKYTNHVVICYDGDAPGIEATKKAIEMLTKHKMSISIVLLKEGLDPDEFVNKYGEQAFLNFVINEQKSYKDYMYEIYYKGINFNNISTIESFKRKIFQLISTASLSEQEIFLNRLSSDIHVTTQTLNYDFNLFKRNIHVKVKSPEEKIYENIQKIRPKKKIIHEALETMVFLCLHDRKYSLKLSQDDSIYIPDEQFRRIFTDLNHYYTQYHIFDDVTFMENYVKDNEKYKIFFNEILETYQKLKIEKYNETHFNQSISYLNKEHVALLVDKMMKEFNLEVNEGNREAISQKILDYFKMIKTK